jgi:hypothetical protein
MALLDGRGSKKWFPLLPQYRVQQFKTPTVEIWLLGLIVVAKV